VKPSPSVGYAVPYDRIVKHEGIWIDLMWDRDTKELVFGACAILLFAMLLVLTQRLNLI
jgi:hypothetical protein